MTLCEAEKLSLTQEVLQTARDALEAGKPIEHLLSYGFDLMSQLSPPSAPSDKIRQGGGRERGEGERGGRGGEEAGGREGRGGRGEVFLFVCLFAFREFISAIANHFIGSNQGALLYLIKVS